MLPIGHLGTYYSFYILIIIRIILSDYFVKNSYCYLSFIFTENNYVTFKKIISNNTLTLILFSFIYLYYFYYYV